VRRDTISADKGADGLHYEELSNGAVLVYDPDSSSRSAALGLFVRAGSRDERRSEWGAAHALEHVVFRGAGHLDREAIAREMDRLGGDVNAFTTRDLTCYHAHVLDRDARDAFSLLWTLITAPWLRPEDVAVERGIIREELRDALDDAEDRADQAYVRGLWGSHPLAREVLGSVNSVERFTGDVLEQFWRTWYRPENLVVAAAGRVDPGTLDHMRVRVAEWEPGPVASKARRPRPAPVGGEVLARVPGDQVHVVAGWPAPAWLDPQAPAARLLAVAFGGQNSSRLWQRVREREGLAYHVGAGYSGQEDYGDLALTAAVGVDQLDRTVLAMGEEWGNLLRAPLGPDELERAKRQVETGMVFGLETPEGRMHWLARWALARLRPHTLAESLTEIGAVSLQAVQGLAEWLTYEAAGHLSVAVAGPRRALKTGVREQFWDGARVGARV
jgi:predicted Zn-dependent peptidase